MVPGDVRPAYEGGAQARQILNDAEDDLRDWQPDVEESSQEEKLAHKTSRGSADYSRDSGYAAPHDGERTSYDDDKDTDYVRDTTEAGTTTAAQGQEQRMSGGSGAPVSQEELRGEQRLSSSLSSQPGTGLPEATTTRSSQRSRSRDLFEVVAEI